MIEYEDMFALLPSWWGIVSSKFFIAEYWISMYLMAYFWESIILPIAYISTFFLVPLPLHGRRCWKKYLFLSCAEYKLIGSFTDSQFNRWLTKHKGFVLRRNKITVVEHFASLPLAYSWYPFIRIFRLFISWEVEPNFNRYNHTICTNG